MPHYRSAAPSVWIASAIQRTSHIRLGVLAYTLPLHAPARLAEEIAVLDHLSGGRIEVGFGLGHRPEELAALGVAPEERIPIFQERLAVIEALWSGGQVSLQSDHHHLTDVAVHPLPLQLPYPPLWYAGGDAGAARWAGAHGMSLAVGFAPNDRLLPATKAFRAGRAVRFSQEDEQEEMLPGEGRIALMRHLYVAESDERARHELIDDLARLHAHDNPDEPAAWLRETAAADLDKMIADQVYIAGGPETVAAAIRSARDELGVTVFLANPYGAGIDGERVRETMKLLATDVRNALGEG
jgi:alkanesulfonate monooxygenase SsuD/methylene tetrahydromethanopterin reductase-like flavin-dependent oxidoreductase (luciferase family)